MKYSIVVAAAALVAAAPLAAQHEEHSQQQAGTMQHCMMMSGASPAALLQHRESLGLSGAQVTRLETLNARAHESVMPHMQPAMQAHSAGAELLPADRPDFAAYEARVREAADHMVRTHVEMARVAVDALQVLTPEQRARLDAMRDDGMMRNMHQRMMQSGQGGMMEGMQMGGGMMMPCMSPGAASGGDAHRH